MADYSDARLLRDSALFDARWYLATNPDVQRAGVDPVLHYLQHGFREGRKPGPEFDADFYLKENPDVQSSGINPLIHYLRFGQREGRAISTLEQTRSQEVEPKQVGAVDSLKLFYWEGLLRGSHAKGYVYAANILDAKKEARTYQIEIQGLLDAFAGKNEGSFLTEVDRHTGLEIDEGPSGGCGCLTVLLLAPLGLTMLANSLVRLLMWPVDVLAHGAVRTHRRLDLRRVFPPAGGRFVILEPAEASPHMSRWHSILRAAATGCAAKISQALEQGESIELEDPNGYTAIHVAALYDQAEIIDFLVQHGADYRKLTASGESALQIASRRHSAEAMAALRKIEPELPEPSSSASHPKLGVGLVITLILVGLGVLTCAIYLSHR